MSSGTPAVQNFGRQNQTEKREKSLRHKSMVTQSGYTARSQFKIAKAGKRKFLQDKYDSEMFSLENLQALH